MKLVTVVGTRPQFVKAAMVSRKILDDAQDGKLIEEVLVHSGQHYDEMMSDIFFTQLGIPKPKYNIGVGSGSHAVQTGEALIAIEKILLDEGPDAVLVYGDCNATLSGGLAASKLNIPLVHVEAGLRSFNRDMPEEINRVLTDSISDVLYCPTQQALENLRKENALGLIENSGDVMFDCALAFRDLAEGTSRIIEHLKLTKGEFCLCTIHRAENTDNTERLQNIFSALKAVADQVQIVLPLHPRTLALMGRFGLELKHPGLKLIKPVSYLDMVMLEANSKMILTDSGGIQKEAFFHGKPCITLRNETEWRETVELGWNRLVGSNFDAIQKAFSEFCKFPPKNTQVKPYGDGKAAEFIVNSLKRVFG